MSFNFYPVTAHLTSSRSAVDPTSEVHPTDITGKIEKLAKFGGNSLLIRWQAEMAGILARSALRLCGVRQARLLQVADSLAALVGSSMGFNAESSSSLPIEIGLAVLFDRLTRPLSLRPAGRWIESKLPAAVAVVAGIGTEVAGGMRRVVRRSLSRWELIGCIDALEGHHGPWPHLFPIAQRSTPRGQIERLALQVHSRRTPPGWGVHLYEATLHVDDRPFVRGTLEVGPRATQFRSSRGILLADAGNRQRDSILGVFNDWIKPPPSLF